MLRVASGHLQQKMCSVHWPERSMQVRGFKTVLKAAKGPNTSCCQCPVGKGEQAKAAFIHAVQIEQFKAFSLRLFVDAVCFYDFFLNASTAASSLLAWLFLTTLIFAACLVLTCPA